MFWRRLRATLIRSRGDSIIKKFTTVLLACYPYTELRSKCDDAFHKMYMYVSYWQHDKTWLPRLPAELAARAKTVQPKTKREFHKALAAAQGTSEQPTVVNHLAPEDRCRADELESIVTENAISSARHIRDTAIVEENWSAA